MSVWRGGSLQRHVAEPSDLAYRKSDTQVCEGQSSSLLRAPDADSAQDSMGKKVYLIFGGTGWIGGICELYLLGKMRGTVVKIFGLSLSQFLIAQR